MSGRSRHTAAPREIWHDPAELLRHLGVTGPSEIDVEAIARYCGARVSYRPLAGCEGRIVGRDGRAVIVVSDRVHRFRQRFTIAHELGHWMWDRGRAETAHVYVEELGPAVFDQPSSDLDDPYAFYDDRPEQRANRWAAELLMPEVFFRPDAAGRAIDFATARVLARRYRTSLTATALRLIELGSTPSMMVCSRRGQRFKWFKHGAGVTDKMWPHPEPRPGTLAHALLRGEPVKRPAAVASDAWFKRKDAWWYRVIEDSVKSVNGEVLSLLSWPDEAQLEATFTPQGTWLPWQPGKGARRRLLRCLREKWGYRRLRGKKGEAVLETDAPSPQKLTVPPIEALDAEGFRGLVDEVAAHKGVRRGVVLKSMLKTPKWWNEKRGL